MEYEIVHSGIKGMRWGIRRYQNPDGTLTAAGKKRYNKELAKVREQEKILKNRQATKAKMEALEARKKAVSEGKQALYDEKKRVDKTRTDAATKPKKKSIKDMTDEELASTIKRIQMEKQYNDLIRTPEKVSKGKSFIKDTVLPKLGQKAADLASDYLTKQGKKLLGIDVEDEAAKLQKQANMMENRWKIASNKKKLDKLKGETNP